MGEGGGEEGEGAREVGGGVLNNENPILRIWGITLRAYELNNELTKLTLLWSPVTPTDVRGPPPTTKTSQHNTTNSKI